MSFSIEPPPQLGKGTLIAKSHLGVDIDVVDGTFASVARGLSELKVDLPEGLYTVRFSAAGRSEDKTVRLLPLPQPLVVRGGDFALESAPPARSADAAPLELAQAEAVSSLGKRRQGQVTGQEIVVFVRAPDQRTRSDVARSIRLFDADEVAMKDADAEVGPAETESRGRYGWAARRYAVAPGCYRLRYESAERHLLEQTVYAFAGRRTFAFLQYGSSVIVRHAATGPQSEARRGIDPGLTTLISTPTEVAEPASADVRLADILLHGIRALSTRLDSKVIGRLNTRGACPYLRIYGAAVLVRRLEAIRRGATDARVSIAEEALGDGSTPGSITTVAAQLLAEMPAGRDLPDVLAMRWRLEMLSGLSAPAGVLCVLPLLDCSWRWIAAYSIEHPGCLPRGGVFDAAAADRAPAGPWLAWRAAAVRHHLGAPDGGLEQLEPAVRELLDRIERGWGTAAIDAPHRASPPTLETLSPGTREVAAAIFHLTERRGQIAPSSYVRQLASYLGTPVHALGDRLTTAVRELGNSETHE